MDMVSKPEDASEAESSSDSEEGGRKQMLHKKQKIKKNRRETPQYPNDAGASAIVNQWKRVRTVVDIRKT